MLFDLEDSDAVGDAGVSSMAGESTRNLEDRVNRIYHVLRNGSRVEDNLSNSRY